MENKILEKIKSMLLDLGFSEINVNNEINYYNGKIYCIPRYIKHMGFIIEYADNDEEAINHCYEDGDVFSLDIGEDNIILNIKNEILDNCS